MFTFIFKGKLYQAKTVKELSLMLKQAGCTDDVEALYVESFNNQVIDSDISEEMLEAAEEESQQISDEVEQDEENNFKSAMEALEQEQELQDQLTINLENEPKN